MSIFSILLGLCIALISGCSSNTNTSFVEETTVAPPAEIAVSELPSIDYSSYSVPSTYHGYSCTGDCSGHDAGYQWAEDNDIHNSNDCDGNSNSFIEGCETYAEENPEDSSISSADE